MKKYVILIVPTPANICRGQQREEFHLESDQDLPVENVNVSLHDLIKNICHIVICR